MTTVLIVHLPPMLCLEDLTHIKEHVILELKDYDKNINILKNGGRDLVHRSRAHKVM